MFVRIEFEVILFKDKEGDIIIVLKIGKKENRRCIVVLFVKEKNKDNFVIYYFIIKVFVIF